MFGFGKKKSALSDSQTAALESALGAITVPAFEKTLAELGWVGAAEADKKTATVELELPTLALKGKDKLEAEVIEKAKAALDLDVELKVLSNVQPLRKPQGAAQGIAGIQNIILVASGKGGVGKSTVATNFAAALSRLGCKVGLLDADVYGPSVPTMAGIADGARPGTIPGPDPQRPVIVPLDRHGMKLMSMGFLVDTKTPMVWRGPMIASACMQLFKDVAWGELDYLVVDLPPGTGDIHLTISQQVAVAGAVVVSTPQDVALADVIRAKVMFDKVNIPCFGIVENMSYFICDECEKRHEIFDHGGARKAAERLGLPFLAEIPLEPSVRASGDAGTPAVLAYPESASSHAFLDLAREVATEIAKEADAHGADAGPTISITGMAKKPGQEKAKAGLPILS